MIYQCHGLRGFEFARGAVGYAQTYRVRARSVETYDHGHARRDNVCAAHFSYSVHRFNAVWFYAAGYAYRRFHKCAVPAVKRECLRAVLHAGRHCDA